MGANSTQAQGVLLFFVAFALLAAGLATESTPVYIVTGAAALAASIQRFSKCRPWEHGEE